MASRIEEILRISMIKISLCDDQYRFTSSNVLSYLVSQFLSIISVYVHWGWIHALIS
jgi:hypothetical protein